MDLCLNKLKDDLYKYNNINLIYEKLKNNNFLINLEKNVQELFLNESRYILTEIKKISKKEKNFNYIEQFNWNFKMFKENLLIILNCLCNLISK